MAGFIHDVLLNLKNRSVDVSECTFILPSKRSCVFLRNALATIYNKTFFSPSILTIEEFVEELSQLQLIPNIELLFEFYDVYLKNTAKGHTDSFDRVSRWARVLLHDFNEIDRFLIPQEHIFEYLSAIQDIRHWSLEQDQTPLVKNYLFFWKQLSTYYQSFAEALINKGMGYQGLLYREALENLENYIQANAGKQHIFIGFNALNAAESAIIQECLHNDMAEIFWDIDEAFLKSPQHQSGYFISKYKSNWKYYHSNAFNWIGDHYKKHKNISVIGVPRNIGQVKYIGEILLEHVNKNGSAENTAVVLGNENLLIPLLNSLPGNIGPLNVTMGYPLKMVPVTSLFENLLILHKNKKNEFYYKEVITILSHPFIRLLFNTNGSDLTGHIIGEINTNNITYLSKDTLLKIAGKKRSIIDLIFDSWRGQPEIALKNCRTLILLIKDQLSRDKEGHLLGLEYLYKFNEVFNLINELNTKHKYIKTIKELLGLYKDIVQGENLDFQGEPLQGLQIMGMLESRVLDFETVIISSVNEGILPSGKSNNSFIPFDVKLENGLPTYKERDAIFTYHFYRLLQRAKSVYILYNTEPDVLYGNEKSRFITQLEIEGVHELNQYIVTPDTPKITKSLSSIPKTKEVLLTLEALAQKGFSPSSLSNYIRNPMDFYYEKVLGIKQQDELEETVAANTLGTVIHNALEDLYKPFQGQVITVEDVLAMKSRIDSLVNSHFKKIYREGTINKGKNLIIYEISKRYISNFLNMEISSLKEGNRIEILEVEADLIVPIDIPELGFPVTLKGKVDRLDKYNDVYRIIDYKTGKVEQNKVEIVNWEDLTSDYTKHSKAFQVLMYAYMMHGKKPIRTPVEAGIISFKNLSSGFLKFAKKDKPGAYAKKETLINDNIMESFSRELKSLIIEICNPEIPFTEKEI
jgi:hypothetical protein